eukprot:5803366-Prymnesium_polylepis.1
MWLVGAWWKTAEGVAVIPVKKPVRDGLDPMQLDTVWLGRCTLLRFACIRVIRTISLLGSRRTAVSRWSSFRRAAAQGG